MLALNTSVKNFTTAASGQSPLYLGGAGLRGTHPKENKQRKDRIKDYNSKEGRVAQGDPYFSRLSSSQLKSQLPPHGPCPCLPVGVGFWAEWGTGLQFSVGILRQVSHHRQFVHVGVDHFFGFHQLNSHFCVLGWNSLCWRMEFLPEGRAASRRPNSWLRWRSAGRPWGPNRSSRDTDLKKFERTWLMSFVVDISAGDWL